MGATPTPATILERDADSSKSGDLDLRLGENRGLHGLRGLRGLRTEANPRNPRNLRKSVVHLLRTPVAHAFGLVDARRFTHPHHVSRPGSDPAARL